MAARASHTFEFPADKIAEAARAEAAYHHERAEHWNGRAAVALERVKATISAKVVEHEVTSGVAVSVDVDHGDRSAWKEYQLAHGKVKAHREQAERYEVDARTYETQRGRPYELDTDDVAHFRLGGEARED